MGNETIRKYGKTIKGAYIKGPADHPATYIPKINLTDLTRNPEAYLKRKMRIIQRIVTWRTKQAALRVLNQALNPQQEAINDIAKQNIRNDYMSLYAQQANHDEIMAGKHFYGLDKRMEIREFLILQLKPEEGKTLEFIDKHAIITIQRNKQLVVTQVVGRDLSRKELVGNGDYTIKVSGKIVDNQRDVYPTKEVQKFLEIMNANDVILCYSPFLSNIGISSMVVKSFTLSQQKGMRNVQDYSFEALFEKSLDEMQIEENEKQHFKAKKMEETKGWIQITKETLTEVLNPKSVLQQSKWI